MITLRLQARWAVMPDGKHEYLNKPTDVKLRSMKNEFGTGHTWHIVWRDGRIDNTLYSSRGKDSWVKRQLAVEFKD